MYQPYPTGGQESPSQAQRPGPPSSILTAVKIMYAGAAVTAVVLVITLLTFSSTRDAVHNAFPHYSASRVRSAAIALVAGTAIIQVMEMGLWLWMAAMNKSGRNWARIVSTVLFGLNTLLLLFSFSRPHATLSVLLLIVVWLIGLSVIILLWRRESTAYYAAGTPS
ncbi:MAG TPA: hypothetical protein VG253_24305 [Streptosporangiaceae bacterium]|jgi:hypothetical protein|nr:hypothetical protein [Streptosporangiaceae bacterium]